MRAARQYPILYSKGNPVIMFSHFIICGFNNVQQKNVFWLWHTICNLEKSKMKISILD